MFKYDIRSVSTVGAELAVYEMASLHYFERIVNIKMKFVFFDACFYPLQFDDFVPIEKV